MATALEIQCAEKYGIDFEEKVRQILPYFWSKTITTKEEKTMFLNLCYTLFSQLKPLNDEFVQFCVFIETRLSYTGQVLSLEKLLNDNFDNTQRRLYIECLDVVFTEGIDVFLDSEVDISDTDIYTDTETNPNTVYWYLDTEEGQEGTFNFNVHIPTDITETDQTIRAILDIYIITGQKYQIIRF